MAYSRPMGVVLAFAFAVFWMLRRRPPRPDCLAAHCHDTAETEIESRLRNTRRDIRLLLIRHGQSAANRNANVVGGRDVAAALSSHGELQVTALCDRLRRLDCKADEVYSSEAVRALQTAAAVCEALGFPASRLNISAQLGEMGMGAWENRQRHEVLTAKARAELNGNNWLSQPPGLSSVDGTCGESQRDVELRMSAFVNGLLLSAISQPANADSEGLPVGETVRSWRRMPTIVLVSHGVSIRCWLRSVLQSSPALTHKFAIDNSSFTELVYRAKEGGLGGWFLVRMNDHAHLLSLPPSRHVSMKTRARLRAATDSG